MNSNLITIREVNKNVAKIFAYANRARSIYIEMCQIVLTGCQTSDDIGNDGHIDTRLIDRPHNITEFRIILNKKGFFSLRKEDESCTNRTKRKSITNNEIIK